MLLFVTGYSPEQQRLQLCSIPARNSFGAIIRGDIRGHWREVDDRAQPMPGAAVHAAGGGVLRLGAHQQGRSVLCCSQCAWVPQDHDQKVNVSSSRDINMSHVRGQLCRLLLNQIYERFLRVFVHRLQIRIANSVEWQLENMCSWCR